MRFSVIIFIVILLLPGVLHAQARLSLATDFGIIRNFKKEQHYWAGGQAINAQLHLNQRDAIYGLFSYYSNGKLKDNYRATAKDPLTVPGSIGFVNSGRLQTMNISVGYKRWLSGDAAAESGLTTYATLGTGVLFGRIENSFSSPIDTNLYLTPVTLGQGNFKRLTLDLGLGLEKPLGADFFLYTEARTFIPISDYPSPFLPEGKYAPFTASLCFGIRILF